ncbi:MAG: hypothetical protein FWC64_02715 [Treponema sp.]|nr:hypothetical protein [Treponema sp.]
MILIAYDIQETAGNKFLYHEFRSCYGWISNCLDDHYKEFASKEEAEKYGKDRGAFYAYGY